MLNDFIDSQYIDERTGLLGYNTWGLLGDTDPEVDSPYLTCYAGLAEIIENKHFVSMAFPWYCYTKLGIYYTNLVAKYIAYEDEKCILLRRYPYPGQNYQAFDGSYYPPKEAHFNNPWNLSGDNTLPIVILMGELGLRDKVKKIFRTHLRRKLFYQNDYTNDGVKKFIPDFMLFHLSVFIRSMGAGKWLLHITDLLLLMNVFIHVLYSWKKKDNTASELNYYFPLVQAQRFNPTLWSWICVKLYKLRGKIYVKEHRITGAIKEFFTIRGDKRPPMHIILKYLTLTYFGEK